MDKDFRLLLEHLYLENRAPFTPDEDAWKPAKLPFPSEEEILADAKQCCLRRAKDGWPSLQYNATYLPKNHCARFKIPNAKTREEYDLQHAVFLGVSTKLRELGLWAYVPSSQGGPWFGGFWRHTISISWEEDGGGVALLQRVEEIEVVRDMPEPPQPPEIPEHITCCVDGPALEWRGFHAGCGECGRLWEPSDPDYPPLAAWLRWQEAQEALDAS